MSYEQLRLEHQLCFPVYAAARLFIREYQPHLDALGITYPQYLALLVLWEHDEAAVGTIAERLILNTNTVTPLLKRLEARGLIVRRRSDDDERRVIVALTEAGRALEAEAAQIPARFVAGILPDSMGLEDLRRLKEQLSALIEHLSAPR